MSKLTFNLTRTQLETARKKLQLKGVNVVGDNGTLSAEGVTVDFAYAEPVFTITVASKPFYVPEAVVESKIRNWFSN